MKTIKLYKSDTQNEIHKNISNKPIKKVKFPYENEVIAEISKLLKKSVDEIKIDIGFIKECYTKKLDTFFEQKIIEDCSRIFDSIIFPKSWDIAKTEWNTFKGWHYDYRYLPKIKTIEFLLSYNNRIQHEDSEDETRNGIPYPKFVQYWKTDIGKKEIEFIEKTLENFGKIKIEICDKKNKVLDIFFIKYKRARWNYKYINQQTALNFI